MRQAKDRGVQLGPWHWHKVVLDEGELDGVLGQAVLQHVHVASLEERKKWIEHAGAKTSSTLVLRPSRSHCSGYEPGGQCSETMPLIAS